MRKILRDISIFAWTSIVFLLLLRLCAPDGKLLYAQSQPTPPAAATQSPAPPLQPVTLALSPLGQKSIENIQLRFQLLQRDLRDLQLQECAAHGWQQGCRLDAEKGVLVYLPPPATPTPAPPKATGPGAAAPKPPMSSVATPKAGEVQKPAAPAKK